jgi:hypothetical protein
MTSLTLLSIISHRLLDGLACGHVHCSITIGHQSRLVSRPSINSTGVQPPNSGLPSSSTDQLRQAV